MGYNKKYLTEALEQIRNDGEKRKQDYNFKRSALAAKEPRLDEIDAEIMKIGPMLGISALSGYNDRVTALKEKCSALSKERDIILKNNGIEEYVPICANCDDTGYIGGIKLCDCVKKRAKELSLSALSAEMPIASCRFDNFDLKYYKSNEDKAAMKKIYTYCKKYADEFSTSSNSLLFFGGTGLGKTHLSLAVAGTALEKGFGVVYSPAQNLLQKLEKEHFSYSAETPFQDDVLECDLLIIDDLGAEFGTSFTLSLVYTIINTRLLSNKPTLISTNLSMEELADRYTPRVASRIFGCYDIKRFVGGDIRQQKRLEEIEGKK